MNCPHCDMFTPDNSYKCISCGKIIKETAEPVDVDVSRTPMKKQLPTLTFTHLLLIVVVLGLAVLGYLILTRDSGSQSSNAYGPGERVDIDTLLHEGKTTIFDFYSDYCPPCKKISPLLRKLDEKRDDIAVVKIDINRKGVRGIDWAAPVVRQFGIRSIPYFIIYDASGSRSHEGRNAYRQVVQLLYQERIQ